MATVYTAPEDVMVKISDETMADGRIVEERNGKVVELSMGAWPVMDHDGNIVELPTQCGWRQNNTSHAKAYSLQTRAIALSQGFVPVSTCPHTKQYTSDLHGEDAPLQRLIPIADNLSTEQVLAIENCTGKKYTKGDGNPGCVHFIAERDKRKAAAKAAYDAKWLVSKKVDLDDFKQIAEQMMRFQNAPKAPRG